MVKIFNGTVQSFFFFYQLTFAWIAAATSVQGLEKIAIIKEGDNDLIKDLLGMEIW